MNDGTPEAQAWRVAMNDGLRDQNQYVAVPRRLADIILDIWNIHFRLIKANPRMVKSSLNNRRFRAAYDFLLLRTALHEVDEKIGEWWTKIQEVDADEKEQMINDLNETYKAQKNPNRGSDETDGNSVNYKERSGNRANANKTNGRASNGRRQNQKQGRRNKPAGRGSNTSNGTGYARKNSSGGRRNNGQTYQRPGRTDRQHVNAQPKDSFGSHQVTEGNDVEQKKVKVRHKRRVVGSRNDTDDNPHF
jgi:poly(A) polymerase